jgi:Mn-dependent DtxR family transcriptional regulator
MLLEPEHAQVLKLCRRPMPVADLASDLDLPLGVVRIMLSDLRERGLVTIGKPARTGLTDPQLLKDVADALRRL